QLTVIGLAQKPCAPRATGHFSTMARRRQREPCCSEVRPLTCSPAQSSSHLRGSRPYISGSFLSTAPMSWSLKYRLQKRPERDLCSLSFAAPGWRTNEERRMCFEVSLC